MKLILSILLLGGSTIVGCANVPLSYDECNANLYSTAMETQMCLNAAAKYKQEQFDKADKRLVKRDGLITFLNTCNAIPYLVVVEIRRTSRPLLPNSRSQQKAVAEYGVPYTHDNVSRHARRYDFKCINPRDIRWGQYNLDK